jgi:hypothetical protein
MASRWGRIVGRVLGGALIILVVLVGAVSFLVRREMRGGEQEAREGQVAEAETVGRNLERLRDRGPVEAADVKLFLRRVEGGRLYSLTDRPGEVYVVARVGAFGGLSFGVQSGPKYACFGFHVPLSREAVTLERLSPNEGRWPEECRSTGPT